jgi:hypothetical protein
MNQIGMDIYIYIYISPHTYGQEGKTSPVQRLVPVGGGQKERVKKGKYGHTMKMEQ